MIEQSLHDLLNLYSYLYPTFAHVAVFKLELNDNVDCVYLDHTRNFNFFRSEGVIYWPAPTNMQPTSTEHYPTQSKYLFKTIDYMYEFEVIVTDVPDSLPQDSSTKAFFRK